MQQWGTKSTDQSVTGSNHLPDEAAPAYVVPKVSTNLHLELGPSVFECICAELQRHTASYMQHLFQCDLTLCMFSSQETCLSCSSEYPSHAQEVV